ncbi:hypothetical protein [Novosphingobium album (ex Liu et al. 2023)]|uniref:Uncharacterized protein n=1 Tax=Novosphingobium album (ex Liu et al. 2023) TaxID=3031130 RepID=A0ABT5WKL9_9SPHN|nr:hypothetical protein [Novosphingobium album (ex Liu et al. 2023)]MDE8650586.1 hypothetical protein [Novosphingobium album (ex Liu et al. 2023)]
MVDMAGRAFGATQRLANGPGGARGAALGKKVTRGTQMVNRRRHGGAVSRRR